MITLLSMGVRGYKALLQERKTLFTSLLTQLEKPYFVKSKDSCVVILL